MTSTITITHEDRRRLGTMLQSAQALGIERQEYLYALEVDLERARGADPTEVPPDLATMNSTVELRDLETGEIETYTIVYPERADVALERISVLAPIGRAVLGSRVGDVVEVKVPSGWRHIRVEGIRYQPENAGDYHL
jgi:regulator of nucleoside diphosphate kinase